MTTVRYSKSLNEIELEVSGHSGFDEPGKDIVCAAISILAQTLIAEIENVADKYDFKMDSGYVWIKAYGDVVGFPLDTVLTGYRLLEQNYPEYIEIVDE